MKAAWYERNGPARDVLTVGTMPDPVPGVGEVRVRMIASGVNPSDWKSRSGSRPMIAPRVIPHSDGAGVIDQVGPGAPSERLGQRVWVWNGQWNRAFGTAAEFIVLPAMQAAPLPSNVSFEEGACLGIPALTAYRAVTIDGSIKGQAVLVTGGAGAVGSYAIQFARLLGAAKIFATVSSPEKAKHALASGADVAIDYKTEDVAAREKQQTGGDGVDRVVEVDGSANARLLPRLIKRDGVCVVYGSSGAKITFDFGPMIMSGAAVRFFIVYELAPDARDAAIAQLTRWLESGVLSHRIARSFPLEQIAAAHEAVEAGAFIGNVVVNIA